jgi:hypothetical protein
MSATLSRRHGRVALYPPLLNLPSDEKLALTRITAARDTEFEDLPQRYQRLILDAEANRQRHVEAHAAGDPYALDHLWAQAAGMTLEQAVQAGALPGRPQRKRPRRSRVAVTSAPSAS